MRKSDSSFNVKRIMDFGERYAGLVSRYGLYLMTAWIKKYYIFDMLFLFDV